MASSLTINLVDERPRQPTLYWTLESLVCWCLVAAVVFVMGADFRGDTGERFTVHWQIYLRLLVAFVCGVVGLLLLFPKTYRDFVTWPGLLITAYVGWYALTLPLALNKGYSVAAWVSLLGVVILIPGAMRLLGGPRFLYAIAAGLVAYLVGSWVAYLYFPEIGVFNEQVTETEVFERMGGLGHPNELGFYSAYTVLIFAGLGVSRRMGWMLAGCGMLLGAVTLLGCFSRTATLVCCIGLVITLQDHLRLRGNAVATLLLAGCVTLAGFFALGSGQLDWAVERAMKQVTKTGNTDELATATGRTEIWEYGLGQIAESPLYGYGYCSARFLMEDYSYHCHNIVLNAMMFGGIVSGILVGMMILCMLSGIFFAPRPEIDGLAAAMLAGGMVEGLLGAPSPAASIMIWMAILFWRQLDMRVAPERVPPFHPTPATVNS